MSLTPLVIFIGVSLFGLLAMLGDRQFVHQERLPVRWGKGAVPETFISKRVGLAFFPLFGTLTLLLLCRTQVYVICAAVLILATANLAYFRAITRKLAEA